MRRRGVLVVVLGGLFVLGMAPQAEAAPSQPVWSAHATAAQSVSMVDFSFSPKNLTVHVGDSVTWTNNGSSQHTVTADGGAFNSGSLNPGATFSHTFAAAGSFPYHCQFHGSAGGGGMSGVITVASAAPPTTVAPATTVPTPGSTAAPGTPGSSAAPGSGAAPAAADATTTSPTTVAELAHTGAGHSGWLLLLAGALIAAGAGAGLFHRRRTV